jgi:hypothetical protein
MIAMQYETLHGKMQNASRMHNNTSLIEIGSFSTYDAVPNTNTHRTLVVGNR